ncbi:MAG: hypothetical protein NUV56_02955, partial [Candidatus Uhrbacteria bacterium]|nr:hypothetical protein [Candidatus Uhrbacteria bacterium]
NGDSNLTPVEDPEPGNPGTLLVHAVRNGEEESVEFALEPYTVYSDDVDLEDRDVLGKGATGTTIGDLPKSGRLLVDLGLEDVPRTEDGHPIVEVQGGLYTHAEALAEMDQNGDEIYIRMNQLVGEGTFDCTVAAFRIKASANAASRAAEELRGSLLYEEPLDRQWIGMRGGQYIHPEVTPTFNSVLIPQEQLVVSGTKLQAVGGPDGLSPILAYDLDQDQDFAFTYYRREEAHLYDVACKAVE